MTALAGGTKYPSAKFGDSIGSSVSGTVIDATDVQAREFGTGTPRTWPDGNPVMQVRVTLAQPDDTRLSLFVKHGRMLGAVKKAIAEAGASDIEAGGFLKVTFTGTEQGKGQTPAKTYSAEYQRPKAA